MNISAKFLRVWKRQESNGYIRLDLGDSQKKQDGTYENWTWYGCLLVGNAKGFQCNEGDLIAINSGIVKMEKYNDKWSPKVIIFEAELMRSGGQHGAAKPNGGFHDDIPF